MDERAVPGRHRWVVAAPRLLSVIVAVVVLCGCAAAPAAPSSPPSATAQAAATPAAPTSSLVQTTVPTTAPTTAPTTQASQVAASAVAGMLPSITQAATAAPVGSIQVVMSGPPPVFRPAALTAKAGEVGFYLQNDSPAGDAHGIHTLAIGHDRTTPIALSGEVPGGRRAVFTIFGLEAGEYVVWCTLAGHAGLGQVGTLTVE